MSTPHNEARPGDFAKIVLMPGDPNRAKYIATNFLHDCKLVNNVRGVQGYTGYTKNNVKISVMASGMGMASISIYAEELFRFYGVEAIIRIGTCGAYMEDIALGDLIVCQGASTDSAGKMHYILNGGNLSAIADYDLLCDTMTIARNKGLRIHSGSMLSSTIFYDYELDAWKKWASYGVLGVEMEAYALYEIAMRFRKKALAICTVTDSTIYKEILTPEQRETGLVDMINLAIEVAEKNTK